MTFEKMRFPANGVGECLYFQYDVWVLFDELDCTGSQTLFRGDQNGCHLGSIFRPVMCKPRAYASLGRGYIHR